LIALASAKSIVELATTLLGWSSQVTACTDGAPLSRPQREALAELDIEVRTEKLSRLIGQDCVLHAIEFVAGPPLPCSAIFFGAGQSQASRLFEALGCKSTDEGLIAMTRKQSTDCAGLFVAGDADSDVQLAIVAAAEGAIAAIAINKELIAEM
jgi:thioredoxin reductase